MITKDLQAVKIDGSLSGTKVAMGIHADAVAHIMYQLANLYNDPILAFVREASTNADDARVAQVIAEARAAEFQRGGLEGEVVARAERAGLKAARLAREGKAGRATEVTLPGRLAPMFSVRDYGIGMSFDDIVQIYSQYGASTKRESNDFNGALGFGCKAPLAYTPQFSVTSVQGGERVTVSISREADGGGNMTIVERVPTTEPNGTTVMIPVQIGDVGKVRERAGEFYRYWRPGTVKVNGAEPELLNPELRLTPEFAVVKGYEENRIVMANVAYPVPGQQLHHGLSYGYSLVAEVPTGDVEFTPSREALKMTPDTRTRLDKVAADFKAACKGAIQRQIDAAPDKSAAVRAMTHWEAALPAAARSESGNYTYQGAVLPSEWKIARQPGAEWPFLTAVVNTHIESHHDTAERIPAKLFGRAFFITGWKSAKLSGSQKRRMKMWLNATHGGLTYDESRERGFVMCRAEEIPADVRQWIDPNRIVSWAHIKATYKLPSTATGGSYGSWKKVAGSYDDVWTEDGAVSGETPASAIRQDAPIYYYQTREGRYQSAWSVLKNVHTHFTVVKLPANRVAKFERDFPAAKHIRFGVEASYDAWRKSITPDQLKALAADGRSWSYANLDPAKIDDPAIKEAIRIDKIDLTAPKASDTVYGRLLGKRLDTPAWKNPMDSYPLAERANNDRVKAHMYLYLNAVYAARQRGDNTI
jgi:hypothetical protein